MDICREINSNFVRRKENRETGNRVEHNSLKTVEIQEEKRKLNHKRMKIGGKKRLYKMIDEHINVSEEKTENRNFVEKKMKMDGKKRLYKMIDEDKIEATSFSGEEIGARRIKYHRRRERMLQRVKDVGAPSFSMGFTQDFLDMENSTDENIKSGNVDSDQTIQKEPYDKGGHTHLGAPNFSMGLTQGEESNSLTSLGIRKDKKTKSTSSGEKEDIQYV
ncbi:hypothetical protein L1987_07008 [Smallanthus sonchifolius]|uniref:Uncharacterized protein n=1 Tax=Smallanthus sonchifolius TaxID=185202 RepID=A0ACB9JZW9_9ASTR|nr:hypothetical protein L1987_07008 [Smallanthus sonchifolius]